jgi:signal transduction histidine kinase
LKIEKDSWVGRKQKGLQLKARQTIASHGLAAREFAARNSGHRLPVNRSRKLSSLAAPFNVMCDSIEEAPAEPTRQEQIQTIGRLATSLVHDLRNPLAAIYAGAETLIDHRMSAEQTQRVASNIHRACSRVLNLLGDLLNVSRGETQCVENCRLRDMIEAATESVESPNGKTKIRIAVDHSIELTVDRSQIERVFINLLSNAIEAMPEGADIFVYSKNEQNYINVFVQDTGYRRKTIRSRDRLEPGAPNHARPRRRLAARPEIRTRRLLLSLLPEKNACGSELGRPSDKRRATSSPCTRV